jgi:hypothetical protein
MYITSTGNNKLFGVLDAPNRATGEVDQIQNWQKSLKIL